jgi:UPF0755 protein
MAASGLATLAIAVTVVALWGLWALGSPGPAARHGAETTVILRRGAKLPEIAADLEEAGVVRSSSIFIAAAQITNAARSLKAGEYAFATHAPLGRVLSMIRAGKIVHHSITIPEGLTSEQAVAILMASDVLVGSAPVPPEGSILPETYEVVRGDDRAAVLQRMMAARDSLIAELWPHRRADLPFKTPQEALALASIVEKETALPAERPRVAAVFVNRLQSGQRLESDPTVIYALSRGEPLGRPLTTADLGVDSPYNSYRNAGLPPTPICNPSRASIAAVLDPPRTTERYFVANGAGGHAFASSIDEHQRNVQRWREIERRQAGEQTQAAAPSGVLRGEARRGR